MAGSEASDLWNSIHVSDDMPVARLLHDYVGGVCGFDGYRGAGPLADPCDVIGLLWGAVYGLEVRLADALRQVDALVASNESETWLGPPPEGGLGDGPRE